MQSHARSGAQKIYPVKDGPLWAAAGLLVKDTLVENRKETVLAPTER
jgi:hypothetical protein